MEQSESYFLEAEENFQPQDLQYRSIVSFFWTHIQPYKWFYIFMLTAPIISSFYPFAYNYAIKLFLNVMAEQENFTFQEVLFPIGLFLFAQFSLDLIWRVTNIAEWKAVPHVRKSIILESYNAVQQHPYQFFQDTFSGIISSKIKSILDGYDSLWEEMKHGLFHKFFKCLVNFSCLFIINFYLGLFLLAWSVLYIPTMYCLSKKLNKLSFVESESKHSILGEISDKIINMSSIFAFASKQRELVSLEEKMHDDFIPKQTNLYKCNFYLQLVGGGLCIVMFSFILFYMIHLRMHGEITIGDFAFVFGISIIISEDIWKATTSLQNLSRVIGSLKSAFSIFPVSKKQANKVHNHTLKVSSPTVKIANLGFAYDKSNAIFENLNIDIKAGEKVGLVGYSGAGKSTLLSLLLRYFEVSAGQIEIDGQDISNVTQTSLRNNIALIPQDITLFNKSLIENIRYGRVDATNTEVIEACKKAYIHHFIMSLPNQYDECVGNRGLKLSGGQRQRVAIARAILKDAPILILDEATSSLDTQAEQHIQNSLYEIIKDKSKTVIAIAHRISTLKNMDRIIVLSNGRVIEEGSHDQLIYNEKSTYKKLWELQKI